MKSVTFLPMGVDVVFLGAGCDSIPGLGDVIPLFSNTGDYSDEGMKRLH